MKPTIATLAIATAIAPLTTVAQVPRFERRTAAQAESPETIIVTGQRGSIWARLRIEIERAEEAVFARFNDINSTDEFDIHCRPESYGHLKFRACSSNAVREENGKIGTAQAEALRGRSTPGLIQLIARERARKRQQVNAEMQQLAGEDEQLRKALADLSDAQVALLQQQGNVTMVRELSAVGGTLPHDDARVFEIIMGNDPYRLRLMQQTFTVANVVGEIRKIGVECAEGSQRIEYVEDVDWALPNGWSACVLRVDAKKGTTFNLYEF